MLMHIVLGRWFPPGAPDSSTSETDISSSSFHCIDMTLAVAEALSPIKPKPCFLDTPDINTYENAQCSNDVTFPQKIGK